MIVASRFVVRVAFDPKLARPFVPPSAAVNVVRQWWAPYDCPHDSYVNGNRYHGIVYQTQTKYLALNDNNYVACGLLTVHLCIVRESSTHVVLCDVTKFVAQIKGIAKKNDCMVDIT